MSQTVVYRGRLVPTGKTVNEVMKDIKFPDYYDKKNQTDIEDFFMDEFDHEKVVINDRVFDVEKEDLGGGDIFQATENPDGSFDFLVKYYNGGCSFDEAIDLAVRGQG